MKDKELLELAAKAAGIVVVRSRLGDPLSNDMLVVQSDRNPGQQSGPWNPLTDDGDALRLAVRLGVNPEWDGFDVEVCRTASGAREFCYVEPHGADPCAATRRAIVRAAAAIGEAMP